MTVEILDAGFPPAMRAMRRLRETGRAELHELKFCGELLFGGQYIRERISLEQEIVEANRPLPVDFDTPFHLAAHLQRLLYGHLYPRRFYSSREDLEQHRREGEDVGWALATVHVVEEVREALRHGRRDRYPSVSDCLWQVARTHLDLARDLGLSDQGRAWERAWLMVSTGAHGGIRQLRHSVLKGKIERDVDSARSELGRACERCEAYDVVTWYDSILRVVKTCVPVGVEVPLWVGECMFPGAAGDYLRALLENLLPAELG